MSQTTTDTIEEVLRATELTPEERYRLLISEQRRVALDVLSQTTGAILLDDLAEEVARQTPAGEENTEQVAVLLHHTHLPRMDDMDLINYDPESHWIEPQVSTQYEQQY